MSVLFWIFIVILIILFVCSILYLAEDKSIAAAICLLSAVVSAIGICGCICAWKAIGLLSNGG